MRGQKSDVKLPNPLKYCMKDAVPKTAAILPRAANRLGRFTAGAQLPQAQGIMPFRQPNTRGIRHDGTMIKRRRRPTERAIQQQLPRRAHQQIRATHDFRDLHRGIIHHARELIRRHVIRAPHHEIPKIPSRNKLLRTEISVHETYRFAVRHAKPPAKFPIQCRSAVSHAARISSSFKPRHVPG